MKTIIILLVSVIINTNLLAQNVLSFKSPDKDTSRMRTDSFPQLDSLKVLQIIEKKKLEQIKKFTDEIIDKTRKDSIQIENLLNIIKTKDKAILESIDTANLKKELEDNDKKLRVNIKTNEDSVKNNIVSISNKIDSLKKLRDSINLIVQKDNLSDFQCVFRKGNNQTVRKGFWKELGEPRKNMMLSLSLGDIGGTFFSEVLTDYLGPVRLSLSTAITATKKNDTASTKSASSDAPAKDNNETLQSFLNGGGGNAIFRGMLPLLYWSNRLDDDNPGKNTRYFAIFFSSKVSGTLPIINSSINNPSGLMESSIEAQFGVLSEGKTFGIEGLVNLGGFYASQDIMNKLTREDFKNIAFYSQGCIKFTLKEEFLIYLNFPIVWLGMKDRNFAIDKTPFSISFSTFLDKKK